MKKSKIEWCDHTWNAVTGCTKESAGCQNCYAARMAPRLAGQYGYPVDEPFRVTFHPDKLDMPKKWTEPSIIFVDSMSDFFHPDVTDNQREQMLCIMAEVTRHKYMILTKRAAEARAFFVRYGSCPDNVWYGMTIENQEMASYRRDDFMGTPVKHKFLSIEPILSNIDLSPYLFIDDIPGKPRYNQVNWVICGGESGQVARPSNTDWIRSIRDQCQKNDIPFLFKQWGVWRQIEGSGSGFPTPVGYWTSDYGIWSERSGQEISSTPDERFFLGLSTHSVNMARTGKPAAGRLLDGVLWDQYPEELKKYRQGEK